MEINNCTIRKNYFDLIISETNTGYKDGIVILHIKTWNAMLLRWSFQRKCNQWILLVGILSRDSVFTISKKLACQTFWKRKKALGLSFKNNIVNTSTQSVVEFPNVCRLEWTSTNRVRTNRSATTTRQNWRAPTKNWHRCGGISSVNRHSTTRPEILSQTRAPARAWLVRARRFQENYVPIGSR